MLFRDHSLDCVDRLLKVRDLRDALARESKRRVLQRKDEFTTAFAQSNEREAIDGNE